MACTHIRTIKYNEATVCLQCGMTFVPGEKPFFDKEIVKYRKKGKKNGSKKK